MDLPAHQGELVIPTTCKVYLVGVSTHFSRRNTNQTSRGKNANLDVPPMKRLASIASKNLSLWPALASRVQYRSDRVREPRNRKISEPSEMDGKSL
jgi:hypothetical protein